MSTLEMTSDILKMVMLSTRSAVIESYEDSLWGMRNNWSEADGRMAFNFDAEISNRFSECSYWLFRPGGLRCQDGFNNDDAWNTIIEQVVENISEETGISDKVMILGIIKDYVRNQLEDL